MKTEATIVDPLIDRLCAAVRLGEVHAITERIKNDLESFIPAEGLTLPEHFRQPMPDRYARRLLYRDDELGFTAVVMTWGPGQRTALHDHAGIWCVEGVIEGEMAVTRYELLAEEADGLSRCSFRPSSITCWPTPDLTIRPSPSTSTAARWITATSSSPRAAISTGDVRRACRTTLEDKSERPLQELHDPF